MKRLLALLASSALLAVPLVVVASPAEADHKVVAEPMFICDGTVSHTTFEGNVVVPDGATCVIRSSTVLGSVRTQSGAAPAAVSIINTDVRLNINLQNVTDSVTIGTEECAVDPEVGRNLKVRNSANVAICEMRVANNLVLRENTGRMMVRDNLACDNIRVVRNDLIGLRVLRNRYVVNMTIAENQVERTRIVKGNKEKAGTPAACRQSVRAAIG